MREQPVAIGLDYYPQNVYCVESWPSAHAKGPACAAEYAKEKLKHTSLCKCDCPESKS